MSILRRVARSHQEQRTTYSLKQLGIILGNGSGRGPQAATIDRALRDAATWACINVKAKSIAELPVDVYQATSEDGRKHASVPRIIANPSPTVSRRAWMFQLASSLFTDGNAYGIVADESGGWPTIIELVDPECVTRRAVVNGIKTVWIDNVEHKAWPFGDLWHMAGETVMAGSPFGLSPIQYGASQAGASLAAEEFGARFFSDGGHPSAIIKAESEPTQEQAERLKAKILAATSGASREPIVLPSSITWEQISVNPDDSQFIETMRWEVEQTCRRHGVPPTMVFGAVSGSEVTYANVTQNDLAFLKHTLSYPISLIEDALSALMPRPRFVKFNRDAILRADTLQRYQVHAIALANKLATVNEIRALEDEEPFGPEFDVPGLPGPAGPPAALAGGAAQ